MISAATTLPCSGKGDIDLHKALQQLIKCSSRLREQANGSTP
eukprot:CAMPEP_0204252914 /NCGR_PEP_ID=MMETSP0468-20130131/1536_1 /ASSEMBLY_ACC=CAM_ASM_000383 /TAXON_ID=2969 /ORGANISM="Oxyrrhis marina" /LENGTH=41 /DNA_ID= /DNA_START= /DNA_END= /DNA_ORIENTATION=